MRKARIEPELDVVSKVSEIDAVIIETEVIRMSRDAQLGRRSKLEDQRYRAFRRRIVHQLATSGETEVTTLRIHGELVAYALGLFDRSAYRLWDTRFSPRWAWYGVGHLVVDHVLKRMLADPRVDEFDFLRGVQEYKLHVANDVVPSQHLEAWSSPSLRAFDNLGTSMHDRLSHWKRGFLGRRRTPTAQVDPPG
jgi:CelD/BcsL family acetyltransferase involved in cellulose biosynthesis